MISELGAGVEIAAVICVTSFSHGFFAFNKARTLAARLDGEASLSLILVLALAVVGCFLVIDPVGMLVGAGMGVG